MLVTTPAAFRAALANLPQASSGATTARAAFLVAPAATGLAAESATDNRYMQLEADFDIARARAEHAALAAALRDDVPVVTFPGDPATPDAMFPNNVFATTPGHLVIARMRHPVRQREAARRDIRDFFRAVAGYREIDLSDGRHGIAELTGSLVIDHARGIGYCGLSERCDIDGARALQDAFRLPLMFCFQLAAGEYHTNVVMASLAARAVILAPDGFADVDVPRAIADVYPGRTLWLTATQKAAYAANAITLAPNRVWMSAGAAAALTAAQRTTIAEWGFAIGTVDLAEIEKAGGSLRCCVAEIF